MPIWDLERGGEGGGGGEEGGGRGNAPYCIRHFNGLTALYEYYI